jgi:enamine deaminase RidA (YjgF/YER057c/UK114 family)
MMSIVSNAKLLSSSTRLCRRALTDRRMIHVEKRLEELGIELPKPSGPRANYNPTCPASGNMLFVSGHLPFKNDGTLITGRIGEDGRDKDYGYEAARTAALNIISTLKKELGDLDRVERIVKVFGIVQSTDDFKEQPFVLDGCSDLMIEVFGKEVGYHARSAIGTNTLPVDISVEIEAIVQIKPE